jgi:hypothetical protein
MGALVRTPERYSETELLTVRGELNKEGELLAGRVEAEHKGQVKVRFLAD